MACFLELLDSIFNRRHRNFRPEDMYRPSDATPPSQYRTPRTPRTPHQHTPRNQCSGHPRRHNSSPICGAYVDSLPRNRKRFWHQHSCPGDYEQCQLPNTISLDATLLTVTLTSISSISSSSSSDSSSLGQCRLSMVSATSTSTTLSSSE
ncbi:PP259 [Orf virus]|uniref:PP259 n=1 Tax=Orf virus TaxID=10258 RepID=F1AXF5_ORFV|nr:PP259 [Orf virus]